jgi:hypothetical protein
MKAYTAIIEHCPDTGMYVGFVPGFPGRVAVLKPREVIAILERLGFIPGSSAWLIQKAA